MSDVWKQANFAWWEVGHGKFLFRHPWKQYLKVGFSTRQCAYHMEALNGYLDAIEVRKFYLFFSSFHDCEHISISLLKLKFS